MWDVLRPAPSVQDGITDSPTAGSMTSPAGLSLPGHGRDPATEVTGSLRAAHAAYGLCCAQPFTRERRTYWRMPPLR